MNDRELLELAAKAAGLLFNPTVNHPMGLLVVEPDAGSQDDQELWNPLTDDGDALRLAVKIGIGLDFLETANGILQIWANHYTEDHIENAGDEPYAATRRVITRAAAEIGRSMK